MEEFIESPQGAPDGLCGHCGICCSCKSCPPFSGAFVMATVFAFLSRSPHRHRDSLPTEALRGPLCPPLCHHQHWTRGRCCPCAAHRCFSPVSMFFGSQRLVLRPALLFFTMLKDVFVGSIMRQSVVIRLFQRVCRHINALAQHFLGG